jgi:hypothetical protein
MALKSASFRLLTGELFNTIGQKSDIALATLFEKRSRLVEGGL